MSIGTGTLIDAKLRASSQLTARVGSRIFWGTRPQRAGDGLTFLICQVISDVPNNTLDGRASELQREIRLQVDCYAPTYLEADTIAELVDGVLGDLDSPDLTGWRLNRLDLYDAEAKLNRVMIEFHLMR